MSQLSIEVYIYIFFFNKFGYVIFLTFIFQVKYGKLIYIYGRAIVGLCTLALCQRPSVEPMSKKDSGPTEAATIGPPVRRTFGLRWPAVFVFAGIVPEILNVACMLLLQK